MAKLNLALRRGWREGMLLSGDQIVDYALAVSDNMLTPHESRITNLQSSRISRTGISGFVTRSSIAAMAAIPISHFLTYCNSRNRRDPCPLRKLCSCGCLTEA
jgi:hypothetical protein